MSEKGWIKIYREILDHQFWLGEQFTKGQAWVDLILLAAHKPRKIYFDGGVLELQRGELCWAKSELEKRWKWSKNKVVRFLKMLKNESSIDFKTAHSTNRRTTIISICNYGKYQDLELERGPSNGPSTDQATDQARTKHGPSTDPNTRIKELKNVRNIDLSTVDPSFDSASSYLRSEDSHSAKSRQKKEKNAAPIADIVDVYHELLPMLPSVRKITDARKRQITARWADDLNDMEAWRSFFRHVANSDFLTGRSGSNNGHSFLADLEWITKQANFVKIIEGKYDNREPDAPF